MKVHDDPDADQRVLFVLSLKQIHHEDEKRFRHRLERISNGHPVDDFQDVHPCAMFIACRASERRPSTKEGEEKRRLSPSDARKYEQ